MKNSIICGDCLEKLMDVGTETIDLIYLDPPFFTQRTHTLSSRDNKNQYSFSDKWDDVLEYKSYISERLIQCFRVLKATGSIFLHCDRSASHYLRVALDEVFGSQQFQSEIIWSYRRWSNSKKGLLNNHQVIYFYSKSRSFNFNPIYVEYSPTTNVDQIFQKRERDERNKSVYKKDKNGDSVLMESKKGVPLSDVWEIPYLNPKAKERVGYPTQKPILLLERIIQLTTNEGDTVLDPFCGSGTTLVAAKLLGRNYLGIDISDSAIELSQKRLDYPIKSESNLIKKGKSAYLNQDEKIVSLLKEIEATVVQRNKGIDGFVNLEGAIKPIPIRIRRENESFEEAKNALIKACSKNGYKLRVLINSEKVKFQQNSFDGFDEDIIVIGDIKNVYNELRGQVANAHKLQKSHKL